MFNAGYGHSRAWKMNLIIFLEQTNLLVISKFSKKKHTLFVNFIPSSAGYFESAGWHWWE
jgi:hypothetical protein